MPCYKCPDCGYIQYFMPHTADQVCWKCSGRMEKMDAKLVNRRTRGEEPSKYLRRPGDNRNHPWRGL